MNETFSAAVKSWKTTTLAVLAAAVAILTALLAEFDGDPETVASWNTTLTAIIVAIGLLFARDSDKSSQDVGVRR